MYIIVKGRARALKPSPLHSPSLPLHPDESLPVDAASILQPGATFGELSVLRARPRDCSIFAGGHHHHLYRQHRFALCHTHTQTNADAALSSSLALSAPLTLRAATPPSRPPIVHHPLAATMNRSAF
jgi:hypothetical protein